MPLDAQAQNTSYGLYGMPGAVDTPVARTLDDGEVALSVAQLPEARRFGATFQALPRLTMTFRYSGIGDVGGYTEQSGYSLWDRSLDAHGLILEESVSTPSIALGLRDILGTGVYASEYIVASKSIGGGVTVSGGLGWGRLASRGAFGTTGSRPERSGGDLGGSLRLDTLFRGDVAGFGSFVWNSPLEGLSLMAEYSSDTYEDEARYGVDRVDSPWNFGVSYEMGTHAEIGLYTLGESGASLRLTTYTNPTGPDIIPNRPTFAMPVSEISGAEPAPSDLSAALSDRGIRVLNYEELPHACVVTVTNMRFRLQSQAVDETAQAIIAARSNCERVTVQLSVDGVVVSASDVEFVDGVRHVTYVGPPRVDLGDTHVGPRRFTWSVFPDIRLSLFAPERPVYHDVMAVAQGALEFSPSFILSGQLSASVTGDFDDITRGPKGSLPNVRTLGVRYANETAPRIDRLTLDHVTSFGPLTYGRVTVGYLETMYAGASAEVYHRITHSPWAVGAEVNFVRMRDFDQRLGLRDLSGLAEVNGHVSAYWDTGYRGIEAQLDVGRYLAGDWGATVAINRNFNNGWEIGAYATITDASSTEFGEGEFDKGIRFFIPISTVTRSESRGAFYQRISSLTSDGGQRLSITGRIHERINTSSPRNLIQSRSCWQAPDRAGRDCTRSPLQ